MPLCSPATRPIVVKADLLDKLPIAFGDVAGFKKPFCEHILFHPHKQRKPVCFPIFGFTFTRLCFLCAVLCLESQKLFFCCQIFVVSNNFSPIISHLQIGESKIISLLFHLLQTASDSGLLKRCRVRWLGWLIEPCFFFLNLSFVFLEEQVQLSGWTFYFIPLCLFKLHFFVICDVLVFYFYGSLT